MWIERLLLQVMPQAICSRYGLAVGANMVWLVNIMMVICWPIAYPIGRVSFEFCSTYNYHLRVVQSNKFLESYDRIIFMLRSSSTGFSEQFHVILKEITCSSLMLTCRLYSLICVLYSCWTTYSDMMSQLCSGVHSWRHSFQSTEWM